MEKIWVKNYDKKNKRKAYVQNLHIGLPLSYKKVFYLPFQCSIHVIIFSDFEKKKSLKKTLQKVVKILISIFHSLIIFNY